MEEDPKTHEKVALRANVRPTADKKEIGTWVYMKRMKDEQWKGPGQVWGHLGTNISVKLGSTIWHVRHEDCIRVREENEMTQHLEEWKYPGPGNKEEEKTADEEEVREEI